MEISSVASQAMGLRENLTQRNLGLAGIEHAAQAQQQLADTLAEQAGTVTPPEKTESGHVDVYA